MKIDKMVFILLILSILFILLKTYRTAWKYSPNSVNWLIG